jgi:hypothetical protein
MSTGLQRYAQPPAPDRRTVRAVAEIQSQALTQRAIDRARAELARERMRDIKVATEEALSVVAATSAAETFWADRQPQATGRFTFIANSSAALLNDMLNDLGRA